MEAVLVVVFPASSLKDHLAHFGPPNGTYLHNILWQNVFRIRIDGDCWSLGTRMKGPLLLWISKGTPPAPSQSGDAVGKGGPRSRTKLWGISNTKSKRVSEALESTLLDSEQGSWFVVHSMTVYWATTLFTMLDNGHTLMSKMIPYLPY